MKINKKFLLSITLPIIFFYHSFNLNAEIFFPGMLNADKFGFGSPQQENKNPEPTMLAIGKGNIGQVIANLDLNQLPEPGKTYKKDIKDEPNPLYTTKYESKEIGLINPAKLGIFRNLTSTSKSIEDKNFEKITLNVIDTLPYPYFTLQYERLKTEDGYIKIKVIAEGTHFDFSPLIRSFDPKSTLFESFIKIKCPKNDCSKAYISAAVIKYPSSIIESQFFTSDQNMELKEVNRKYSPAYDNENAISKTKFNELNKPVLDSALTTPPVVQGYIAEKNNYVKKTDSIVNPIAERIVGNPIKLSTYSLPQPKSAATSVVPPPNTNTQIIQK
jgi:hypothetical protein